MFEKGIERVINMREIDLEIIRNIRLKKFEVSVKPHDFPLTDSEVSLIVYNGFQTQTINLLPEEMEVLLLFLNVWKKRTDKNGRY